MTADQERDLEAQARRWLWGFPRGLREERGEEAVGIVVDLCPPGTERLPWGSRLDLVRAGLHVRRRELPPLTVWWQVLHATPRSRHGMVPDRWRPWLVRRLPTTSFLWTWAVLRILMCTAPMLLLQAWARLAEEGNVWQVALSWAGFLGLVAAIQVPVSGGRWRRTMRLRNGLAADGSPLPAEAVRTVARGATFRNLSVRGPLAVLTAVLAVRTATEVDRMALPLPTDEILGPVLMAVGLPLALVAWARWSVDRSGRTHAWEPMARRRTVRAVLAEVIVLLLAAFLLLQLAAVLADLTTPALGSASATAAVGAVLGLVVGRGRRGRPVQLWDLVPATGPLLQVEPLRPLAPRRFVERRGGPAAFG